MQSNSCRALTALAVIVLLASLHGTPASAISPPPPLPVEALSDFYEAMNGDGWHRNENWLDPEVDVCDWYGITCVTEAPATGGYEWIGRIELPDNNLQGELTAELQERLWTYGPASTPSRELDLSGNAIRGEFTYFPWGTEDVNLSGNLLSGSLPDLPAELPEIELERLRLSRNDFEGAVPAGWDRLQLRRLELADNRLDAGAEHAFAAMHGFEQSFLYLNGNRFAAELGENITNAQGLAERGDSNVGAGLDLCYNDFLVEDPAVRDWIAARHVGSTDFEACLGRQRVAVDATASGSWYHPGRPGEGISLMILEQGAPLLYSFGFDSEGRQQWLFELGHAGDRWLRWDPVRETRGYFGEGIATDEDYRFVRSTGRFRADRVGTDTLSLHRHYYDLLACGPWDPQVAPGPGLCPPPLFDDRLDYQRLSRLAGSTCENRSDYQQYSGAWYNPQQSGEGFLIEVLPDDRAVFYWFTYTPGDSGEQAWMIGEGHFESGTESEALIEFETIYQPTGGTYGEAFDPGGIENVDWGSLLVEFDTEDAGRVYWDSKLAAYGSGDSPIQRLARPMLAVCN
ncbi:MAG: hypothetical protein V2J19_09755 [Wenzhouxiangella sp.]|jgi:hypothetical protein|nr:hypothetical protein [Wenzhouxiangella sp.]